MPPIIFKMCTICHENLKQETMYVVVVFSLITLAQKGTASALCSVLCCFYCYQFPSYLSTCNDFGATGWSCFVKEQTRLFSSGWPTHKMVWLKQALSTSRSLHELVIVLSAWPNVRCHFLSQYYFKSRTNCKGRNLWAAHIFCMKICMWLRCSAWLNFYPGLWGHHRKDGFVNSVASLIIPPIMAGGGGKKKHKLN